MEIQSISKQNNYLQVYISAENKEQADKTLNSLLGKKLVAGGLLLKGPARFWWKGKIADMDYYNVSTFTRGQHKQAIIEEVMKISVEEVPMVWFVAFDGNDELLKWIEENTRAEK